MASRATVFRRFLGTSCTFLASKPLSRVSRPLDSLPSYRTFSSSRPCRLMELSCFSETQLTVRDAISKICSHYPDDYWMEKDLAGSYPHELHRDLARDRWIGIALPEILGGAGLGISEATMMLQTITQSGAGIAGAQSIHANVYATQPVAAFATESQRQEWLTPLIEGTSRVCFGVTEPNTGLETLKLRTTAKKSPDGKTYSISGQKIWITNAQIANNMVLLARTMPLEEVQKPSEGLSMFYIPLHKNSAEHPGLTLRKIKKMGTRAVDANEIFFDNYVVDSSCLIGKEGHGFKMILHGMNAERCLLSGESLGLGYAALEKATRYARDRVVFGRPIGKNQAIQHPLADAFMQLEAAKLATYHATKMYDESLNKDSSVRQEDVGIACNTAKYVSAEAAFTACERAVMCHGGMGYASEYHVERYLRESFIPRLAPVSREMIMNFVGEKALGLPRSY